MPLLHDAAMGLRVRNATYRAMLEQSGEEPITEQTASRDFQRLVAAGLLVPGGEKRGRSYLGGHDLRALRRAIVETRDPRDNSDPFADCPRCRLHGCWPFAGLGAGVAVLACTSRMSGIAASSLTRQNVTRPADDTVTRTPITTLPATQAVP